MIICQLASSPDTLYSSGSQTVGIQPPQGVGYNRYNRENKHEFDNAIVLTFISLKFNVNALFIASPIIVNDQ